MKRVILIFMTFVIATTIYSQENSAVHTVKDFKKMKKTLLKEPTKPVGIFQYYEFTDFVHDYANNKHEKNAVGAVYDFSLHDIDTCLLNSIEKVLLSKFLDVRVCPMFNMNVYFLIDNDINIGAANFEGKILQYPVFGLPRNCISGIGFGDTKPYNFSGYDASGLFSLYSVIDKKTCEIIASKDEYQYISVGDPIKQQYIVCKIIDNNEKWGVVDKNGNIIHPIEYKGIIWNGTKLELSMTNSSKDLEGILLERQQRYAAIAASLSSVYNTLEQISNEISSSNNTSVEKSPQTAHNKSESKSSSSSNVNGEQLQTDRMVYSDWENQIRRIANGLDPYNTQTISQGQSTMKRIRQKWESRGIRMYHSEWEDWR